MSLAPITPEQAMAALLTIKPADVTKLEAKDAGNRKGKARKA